MGLRILGLRGSDLMSPFKLRLGDSVSGHHGRLRAGSARLQKHGAGPRSMIDHNTLDHILIAASILRNLTATCLKPNGRPDSIQYAPLCGFLSHAR